jgi:hypothetical protein
MPDISGMREATIRLPYFLKTISPTLPLIVILELARAMVLIYVKENIKPFRNRCSLIGVTPMPRSNIGWRQTEHARNPEDV